jgi:hypothetical protein
MEKLTELKTPEEQEKYDALKYKILSECGKRIYDHYIQQCKLMGWTDEQIDQHGTIVAAKYANK